jgi:hypothetical protein
MELEALATAITKCIFQDYKTNYDSHTEIDKSYFDYMIRGYRDY